MTANMVRTNYLQLFDQLNDSAILMSANVNVSANTFNFDVGMIKICRDPN